MLAGGVSFMEKIRLPCINDTSFLSSSSSSNQGITDDDLEGLAVFKADSANDHVFKNLWFTGVKLFVPQLNSLVALTNHRNEGEADAKAFGAVNCDGLDKGDEFTTKLRDLFDHYGSDKGNFHSYYKFYGNALQQMGVDKELTILEVGLGTNNPDLISTMGSQGKPGASHRAWRDALPNAKIYGADVDRDILFTEDRIETTYVDQLDYNTFDELDNTFGHPQYDLVIDDGLHALAANLNTLLYGLRHVKPGGYVVVEDIGSSLHQDNWKVIHDILSKDGRWESRFVTCSHSGMFVVQRVDGIVTKEPNSDKNDDASTSSSRRLRAGSR